MKRVCLLCVVLLGSVSVALHAQITVRLNIPAKSSHQVLVKNYILRGLLALNDIVLVESGEQFRIDFLAKELLSTNNEMVGLSIAAYLMYRVNWEGVKGRFINENEISPAETAIFEKLPSDVYFPLLFVSDYCTVDGLRDTCASFVDLFNREHFDKVRNQQREQEQPSPQAGE